MYAAENALSKKEVHFSFKAKDEVLSDVLHFPGELILCSHIKPLLHRSLLPREKTIKSSMETQDHS